MSNNDILRNRTTFLRDFILDSIFPRSCISCGLEGVWLCRDCSKELRLGKRQYCLNCKKENRYGEFCPECSRNYKLNGVWIAANYENEVISSLLKNLKYQFIKEIAFLLGEYASAFLHNIINKNRFTRSDLFSPDSHNKLKQIKKSPNIFLDFNDSLLVPVPLHKRRKRWRGFNQAEVIAEVISKKLNIDLNSGKLIRIKYTKPQVKMSERERKINLCDCFLWQGSDLLNRNIILIDDVTTTGSTFNECARALKIAGAGEIWGLAIAKG